jgi:arsenical pump membrane protein
LCAQLNHLSTQYFMPQTSPVTSPCAWISLLTFFACILCVIVTPSIPVFLHRDRVKKLYNRIFRRSAPQPQIELSESIDEISIEEASTTPPPREPMFYWMTLDMATAPIIALVFLFATTCLQWDTFVSGVIGDDKIRPYGVIILFMSLSYVCISLDITGLFEHFAKVIIVKSAGRGHLLFIFFALFASVLTLFTSNDIVILTLTPICCYLAKNAENLDLVPFVICQFFLANIWSVAFQIGNPTNMIVAEAYKMNFLEYFLWMGLPAFVAGVTSFAILYLIFFRRIPRQIVNKEEVHEEQSAALKDKKSAIIKSIGLFLCLLILAITSVVPLPSGATIPAFLICLSFFVLFFIYDIIADILYVRTRYTLSSVRTKLRELGVTQIMLRMPWKIVPFVFGMFVMVELLNFYGFVTLLATGLGELITKISSANPDSSFLNIAATCYVISIISTLACNILNNQPMTILFTKVLTSSAYLADPVLQKASSFSLILGSNLGANVTLIGALAGIMWIQILRNNGIDQKAMNYFKFLMYGVIVTPVALLAATTVIVIQTFVREIQ